MTRKKLTDYSDPKSLGSRMRSKRLGPLLDLIKVIYSEKGKVSILDVGGREAYWKAIPEEFFEKHAVKITILNLPCDLVGNESRFFTYSTGDACDMSEYPDNCYDIVHSNSVIEHVGNWEKIKAFSRETRRLAPNLFVQTPYYWFPIEPHFVKFAHHWLPKSWRVFMWMNFKMGERGKAKDIDEAMGKFDDEPYLLDYKMFSFLFPDCKIIKEKYLFLTKSMVAFRSQQVKL